MKKFLSRLLPTMVADVLWAHKHYGAWHARRTFCDWFIHPFCRLRYQILNRGLPVTEQILPPGVHLRVIPEIRRCFELYSYLDMRNVREMQGFIRYARGCNCLLDIGALYGDFALVFCALTGGSAYAFEPSPEAYKVMKKLMEHNPQADIQGFQLALGTCNAEIEMMYEWIHCVAANDPDPTAKRVRVQQCTLDSIMSSMDCKPDVVKIDTEGSELDIIEGGCQYFQQAQPRIFLEVHPTYLQRRGQSVQALVKCLHRLGYCLFYDDGKQIHDPIRILSKSEGFFVHRIICNHGPL